MKIFFKFSFFILLAGFVLSCQTFKSARNTQRNPSSKIKRIYSAADELVERLRRGEKVNLRGKNLEDADLQIMDLQGLDFMGAKLKKCKFSRFKFKIRKF